MLQCREEQELKDVLERIPDNIVKMYQAALEKVADKDMNRMKLILRWLMTQFRPLSLTEFAAAVELPSQTVVKEICTVLVETSKEEVVVTGQVRKLDTFSFAHFSVKDYLVPIFLGQPDKYGTNSKQTTYFASSAEDAHLQMTKRCLAILSACSASQESRTTSAIRDPDSETDSAAAVSVDGSDSDTKDTESHDSGTDDSTSSHTEDSGCPEGMARKYAAEYWFRHYKKIDRKNVSSVQVKELDNEICSRLLLDNKNLRYWLRIHNPESSDSQSANKKTDIIPSPVYYTVKLKLEHILKPLIEQLRLSQTGGINEVPEVNQRGNEGTALQLAVYERESTTVDALLENGANVNSQKGVKGSALYAAAFNGDKDMVKKLLAADAQSDGTDDGDLGSPLHVAAFRGCEDVVQMLLDDGRVSVDHVAGPFGTALQAACASRQDIIIKQLLREKADPNIVGGYFGTAAMATITYDGLPESGEVMEELLSHGAEVLQAPSFWMTAYGRVSSAVSRQRYTSGLMMGSVLDTYASLLRPNPIPNAPGLDDLEEMQRLLYYFKLQWGLPEAEFPEADELFDGLLCRVPFQDQLDAIKQVALRPKLTIQYLRKKEFLYEALFWAGINYILGRLPAVIKECLQQDKTSFRNEPTALPPLRWAFGDRRDDLYEYEVGTSSSRNIFFRMRWQRRVRRKYGWEELERSDEINHVDRSDLICMELAQQRKRQIQLKENDQNGFGHPSEGKDPNNAAVLGQSQSTSRPRALVTSDVLDLAKYLLEYGGRCNRYQEAISEKAKSTTSAHEKCVQDLAFEVFSAVIRLARALGDFENDFRRLDRPVRLLATVRLERIKQLDAICQKASAFEGVCNHASANAFPESKIQEIATVVAQQVQQTIGDRFADAQPNMVQEIQNHTSTVIKEEVSRQLEKVQKGLEEKIRDGMQPQLSEVQTVQTRRGYLWG